MTGLIPEPNELIQIGKTDVPDLVTVNVPGKVSFDLNRIESPGSMLAK